MDDFRVPFRAKDFIERDAEALLAEYEHKRGQILVPPVPVEEIIEKYLGLRIDFDDLNERHGIPRLARGDSDIIGAIYSNGHIYVDESLDPEEFPDREGRYRFTLAHEGGGHWRLHRHLFVTDQQLVRQMPVSFKESMTGEPLAKLLAFGPWDRTVAN